MTARFESPQSEVLNPLEAPQWNLTLQQFPGATIFHTAEWARVLAEAYRYTPEYILYREGNRAVAALPLMEVRSTLTGNRAVCLPFTDECAPLLAEPAPSIDFPCTVRELAVQRQWRYVEIRSDPGAIRGAEVSGEFVSHRLVLVSEEQQLRKLRESTLRNIRKSERDGVVVDHLRSLEAVRAFYNLHCQTRRRHGVPPQPGHFFDLIHRFLIDPGHGFVSLARFQERWIAGAVYFQFGSKAIYKFGASDPAYQHLRANNLVMWSAIRRLQEGGMRELSFGRTDIDDVGLLQFKRGWGAEEYALRYCRVWTRPSPARKPVASRQRFGLTRRVAQYLPVPLLRWIGRVIYRHLG